MAEFTVFYSWQSDLPRKLTRDVIHNAAKDAVERLGATLEDAPRFDHDTEGVAGVPEIARTIFDKIDRAGMVIADISFVGKTSSENKNKREKQLPNANVLLELGYAAAKVGWDRMILVMNTAFGDPELLPFDLLHRRFPIRFELDSDSRKSVEEITNRLSVDVENAVKTAYQAEHANVLRTIERLDLPALRILKLSASSDSFVDYPLTSTHNALVRSPANAAQARLVELGILKCGPANSPHGPLAAYHWTYLGKLVLKHFGLR